MSRQAVHTLKVIATLARLQLSTAMMYRVSFWGAFLVDLTVFSIQLLFFGVLAQNGGIGDWNLHHLTVFTGAFIALDGLYMGTYFFGVLALPDKIRTGALDLALVKPVNALLYTSFGQTNPGALTLSAAGLGIAAYGGAGLGVLSVGNGLRFIIVLLCMYLLMYALMVGLRTASFWLTRVNAFQQMEGALVEFSFRLPAPAIQGAWKLLLYVLLPYGLMANMPAQALFSPFGLQEWLLCTGVTAFFLGLALCLWHVGLKRYDSASS